MAIASLFLRPANIRFVDGHRINCIHLCVKILPVVRYGLCYPKKGDWIGHRACGLHLVY